MESITIVLVRKPDRERGHVDLGFTAGWLERELPKLVWHDREGTQHRFDEDFEIQAIHTRRGQQ